MLIPDVNLLLYATNRRSPSHSDSQKWWHNVLNGSIQVGLCAPVLFAYVRMATNPRIFTHPISVEQAFAYVENWMDHTIVQWLEPDHSHLTRVKTLLLEAGTGGNLVTDAQIAAYGLQYNATICSADFHFSRFQVKWHNPLSVK